MHGFKHEGEKSRYIPKKNPQDPKSFTPGMPRAEFTQGKHGSHDKEPLKGFDAWIMWLHKGNRAFGDPESGTKEEKDKYKPENRQLYYKA